MGTEELTKAAEQLRFLILAAERQGGRLFQEAFRKIGITGSQAEVLRVLGEREPLSLKQLGALLICENGSPSRLVNRMVMDGLVIRETDPKDSRYVLLRLSAAGHEKAKIIAETEHDLYSNIFRNVPFDEIFQINGFLGALLSGEPIAGALRARGFLSKKE